MPSAEHRGSGGVTHAGHDRHHGYGLVRAAQLSPRARGGELLEALGHPAPSSPTLLHYLFKLRAPESAICGSRFFVRYSRLPDWLAWETFGIGDGCESLGEMRGRISGIRDRIHYRGNAPADIGCILLVQPTFFSPEAWVRPPRDWPARTQTDKKYDLASGEGESLVGVLRHGGREGRSHAEAAHRTGVAEHRYGKPTLGRPSARPGYREDRRRWRPTAAVAR